MYLVRTTISLPSTNPNKKIEILQTLKQQKKLSHSNLNLKNGLTTRTEVLHIIFK